MGYQCQKISWLRLEPQKLESGYTNATGANYASHRIRHRDTCCSLDRYPNRFTRDAMKPKPHPVLEMCIKNGIDYGWMRAHKHTDTPPEDLIKQEIEVRIWEQIDEWFDMEIEQ